MTLPGETLGGYVIVGEIARGGMGVVYRARDEALGRDVALKVIAPALAADDAFRERFRRESRLAAQVEHPSVVPIYEAGEDGGRLFLAMRFIEGADLASLLRYGPLPPDRAVTVVGQVARALDAAHARGLVHRDVKPGNVLVAGERVYLTDFGLTVQRGADLTLTGAGQWVGTLDYAAPEQLRAAPVDARADVYALGGVLYHCLTGTVPFPAEHQLDAITRHLSDPPPRPSEAGAPAAFDPVVARALAKDPAARYPSAGDLAAAAAAAAENRVASRREHSVATGAAAPARAPRRRRWGLGIVVAAAIVVLVLVLGLDDTPSAPANPAGAVSGRPLALGQPPDRLVTLGAEVWALSTEGRLTGVDPRSGRRRSVPVLSFGSGTAQELAAGDGSLWVDDGASRLSGVDRIAPGGQVLARVALTRPGRIAVGEGFAWVISAPARLVAIDTRTNRIGGAAVALPAGVTDVAAGAGAVWVADPRNDRVLRIDPAQRRVTARIATGDGPGRIVASDAAVWVANLGDQTLTHVDPASARQVGPAVSLGKQLADLALGPGALWVAGADGTVTRLDPRTGAQVGVPIAVLGGPLVLAADAAGVWAASTSQQRLQRIRARG